MSLDSSPIQNVHPFDSALELRACGPGCKTIHTNETYWNSIGPFGGWLVAAGLKAILTDEAAKGSPVEVNARFMIAPQAGELVIRIANLAQGKSVGFWRAQIWQTTNKGERCCAEISAILANARDTMDARPRAMPEAPPPESIARVTVMSENVRWLNCYDIRYVTGIPFLVERMGESERQMRSLFWAREAVPRPLDWTGIAALVDVPVPRNFLWQRAPGPVSTVSLTLYMHASPQEVQQCDAQWVLIEVDARAARRGFFDHHVTVWREDGLPLASSTQLAWFS